MRALKFIKTLDLATATQSIQEGKRQFTRFFIKVK